MTAIRTLIADDELLARRTLRDLLADAPDIELITECRDGLETAQAIDALAPDLIFLDIHMPGLDGFAAARKAQRHPVIIFVTAHEQYALRAFDADAIDYLLKPFDDDRFHRALARARAEVQQRRLVALASQLTTAPAAPAPTPAPVPDASPGRLVVKDGARIELIALTDIHCIRAEGYYAELQLAERTVLLREPMQDLEARLDPAQFVRVHRSAIVNVRRVRRIERLGHNTVTIVLQDGARLPVSRSRRAEVERVLGVK